MPIASSRVKTFAHRFQNSKFYPKSLCIYVWNLHSILNEKKHLPWTCLPAPIPIPVFGAHLCRSLLNYQDMTTSQYLLNCHNRLMSLYIISSNGIWQLNLLRHPPGHIAALLSYWETIITLISIKIVLF